MKKEKWQQSPNTKSEGVIRQGKIRKTVFLFVRLDVDFFPTTNNYGTIDTLNNMVKIRNAVITNFEVEYSEGTINPTFFEADQQGNHAPFTVNFTVALKETTVYTKERCEEDYRGTN